MSFILEALKKSEQQRLQQNTPQQEVCKRTFFLCSHRSSRWSYWLVAGFLPLVLVSGWWFYSRIEPATLAPSPAVNDGANHAPSSLGQPRQPEPAAVPPDSVSAPSPLPEAFSAGPSPAILEESRAPGAPPMVHGGTPRKRVGPAAQGATVASEPPEARSRENQPLYPDLSKELLDRIPRLTMSMHYHSSDPGRRLVRVNDRLLHEGDWLSNELHVVEITPTGAILDFLGKSFVLRSPIR
ncbi:MAG: hypothetical protein CVU68_01305 [Deltaproteobacteria bacterium HGW-Deltaproteobacteria-3]|jgi:general secretion pathway protein B|nr:MAG: hypothetical protein CVU68_01305 [Deltaproteobacteria bacterium HGW-Deltaproteobacteria-3]